MPRQTFAPQWSTAQNLVARDMVAKAAGQTDVILWLSQYNGSNDFVLSVREGARRFGSLTEKQEAAIRKFMAPKLSPAPVVTSSVSHEVTAKIPSGTYTIINPKTGGYRTIELTDADTEKFSNLPKGTQIVGYLAGPDNATDFVGFGFVKGATFQAWKRFADEDSIPDWKAAIKFLLSGKANAADAAHAYAIKSGRCSMCQRKLTVPASLHQGFGPICAEKIGASLGASANPAAAVSTSTREDVPSKSSRTYEELFGNDE